MGPARSGAWGALFLAALLAGCAAAPARREPSPEEARRLAVPFFADDTDQCGPSALAAVLSFWGPPVRPGDLKEEIYIARLKGSLPLDLLITAKKRGFDARLADVDLDGLKDELKSGRPLVAFLNLGYEFLPRGHYVAVTGYDDARGGLIVHSGMKKDRFVTYRRFLRDWEKTRRTALLIRPGTDREGFHAER